MKKYLIIYISFIPFIYLSAQNASDHKNRSAEPLFKTGFAGMNNIEQLPLLFPIGTQTKQPLAYDATGGNYDHHFLSAFTQYIDTINLPDGQKIKEYVIFDEYGPGVLYRQQMNAWFDRSKIPNGWLAWGEPNQPRADAQIRYYFDDEELPRIDLHLKDYFSSKFYPYTEPLAFVDSGYLFANNYYPLEFSKRLKVALRPNVKTFEDMDTKWYQYTMQSFPSDFKISTLPNKEPDRQKVIEQWNNIVKNPNDINGCKKIAGEFFIKNGEEKLITKIKKSGTILGVKLMISPYDKKVFFNTQLKIFWDDHEEPDISLPLSYFFGAGGKDYADTEGKVFNSSLSTLMFGFNNEKQSFYNYFPMPFWKSAKIVLTNNSGEDIKKLSTEILFKPSSELLYPQNKTGYFYAKRTVDSDTDTIGYRGIAFKESGRGHIVGITFYSDRYDMDGDEFTYIDDSRTPQIHGSGTEDDHNQGWAGRAYQKPLWGGLFNGYNGAYRIYLNDCYIFNKNILISYEYSLTKPKFVNGGKTDVTTFYYKACDNSSLFLTDEIDVGSHYDEICHQYQTIGLTWKGIVKTEYDGYERNLQFGCFTDDGKAFNGSSSFNIKIDKDNKGVKLRKRINRDGNGVQKAIVFVDGFRMDKPWNIVIPSMSTGKGPVDGWYDSDYEIPAKLTSGKDKLHIEIKFEFSPQKHEINEFYYWIYSYKD
jgi:hypothetical protein